MQTTILSTIDRSTPAPALNGRASSLPGAPASSASPSVSLSRGRGLQLGGKKASSSVFAAQLAEEVANEAGEGANPLWNDDLIDINADEGDWSTFLDFWTISLSLLTDPSFPFQVRSRVLHLL